MLTSYFTCGKMVSQPYDFMESVMNYEELIEKYKIDDICPEINNELNGMFVDILRDDFELGIFSEPSPKNDDSFVITVEIVCDSATLDAKDVKQIITSVEEKLSHNLGKDWKSIQKKFDGVQVIFNEDIVS
ncbi:MAG: hypothetical protein RIR20_693 [Pseudomonadota bacterium]